MRRILLGGLGIALGVFTPPALAQQPAPTTNPPARGAELRPPFRRPGYPGSRAGRFRGEARRAVPRRTGSAGCQLRTRAPVPGTYVPGTYVPNTYAPTPVIAAPPGGDGTVPMPMTPPGTGSPLTQPRPVPSGPMVTETRDPTGRIPNGTVAPSVMPDGFVCPNPGLEDPLCEGHLQGLDRLRGCGRNWVSAELLMWWNRSTQVPPLVTTSSAPFNGIVGQGDTQVLLGGSFGSTFHVGARIGGGHWFDDNECRGFDWRVFWVSPSTASFTASTPPYTLLARPFFNVNPGVVTPLLTPLGGFGPLAEIVGGPGVATGTVAVTMKSTIWGAEANYRRFLAGNACSRLDLLVGYRYLDLREDLTITESFTRVPGSDMSVGVPAVSGSVVDRFRTENQFHGGQIGLAGSIQRGRWSLDTRATVALGTVFQSVDINGAQALVFPNGAVATAPGGLLAVPGANIGHWSQNKFGVVPEVGVNLGYQVTSHLKLFVGYNFLYLSSAVRPGEQIDPRLDAARIPNFLPPGAVAPVAGIVRPVPLMSTSGYFIQGINFGLSYRW